MQTNFHRVKKYIAFLCGMCLSVSIFYNRGLTTYALPNFDNVTINMSKGFLNLSGQYFENPSQIGSLASDFYEFLPDSLYSVSKFTVSGISSRQFASTNEICKLFICYYDENKLFLGSEFLNSSNLVFESVGSTFKFTFDIVGDMKLPDNSKYVRFCFRNGSVPSGFSVTYNEPLTFNMIRSYDDGSFNLGVYGTSGVRFPLNMSGAYNPDFEEGATGWLYGSQILLSGSANSIGETVLTLTGFDKAYYDLDIFITIGITPDTFTLNDFSNGTTKYNNNLRAPFLKCAYPSLNIQDLPDELNYDIDISSIAGTAINYYASNALTTGMKYKWNYEKGEPSSAVIHLYGTTYISNQISIPLQFNTTVNARNFPQNAYSNINQILRFGLDYSVNGIVQKSPHTFSSEIEGLETIDESINNQTQTIISQWEEDRNSAQQAGSDVTSFVSDVMDLENRWEILWFPLKFTNQLLDVFTGGTSSVAYQEAYGSVVGYTYDDETGNLVPVIDKARSSARASGGTIITFPEYTLPYLNVKLWDSYDFDLSFIKESFPALFNALYVVISVIEVFAFVDFLRDKFDEVFGK